MCTTVSPTVAIGVKDREVDDMRLKRMGRQDVQKTCWRHASMKKTHGRRLAVSAPETPGRRPLPQSPGLLKILPGLLLAGGGGLFPLVGASMLAMLLFDRLHAAWTRSRKKQWAE
jgi:hypothetical protein